MANKITFLINSLGGGGAEGVCVNIANALYDCGWQIDLILLNLDNAVRQRELNPAIKITVLKISHARESFFKLRRFILDKKPSKILVFNYQLACLLVFLRYFSNVKYRIIARNIIVLSEIKRIAHSFWHKHIVHFITKVLYRKVDIIIAQSKGMIIDLITNYRIKEKNVTLINNPINKVIESFLKSNDIKNQERGNYILCMGRLEEDKAFHYVIEAFARISAEYPSLNLKIVGQGTLKEKLRQYAENLRVSERVNFEGYQEYIIPYHLHARATVLTSLVEGFPNVLVESIALGTPIVAFDCKSGPSEIVQEGENGYLVRYQDIEHLTECLKKALNQDWKRDVVMATAKRYSSEKIIDEYIKALKI
ncbi:glycosyl transferase [Spirochaetia bacterium]|nr:glycosyl transferase [Spirochaetia bacterium]